MLNKWTIRLQTTSNLEDPYCFVCLFVPILSIIYSGRLPGDQVRVNLMLIHLFIFKHSFIHSLIQQLFTEYKNMCQALVSFEDMIVNKKKYGLVAGIAYLQVGVTDFKTPVFTKYII